MTMFTNPGEKQYISNLAGQAFVELSTHSPTKQAMQALAGIDVKKLSNLSPSVRKSITTSLAAMLEHIVKTDKEVAAADVESIAPLLEHLLTDIDAGVRTAAQEAFAALVDAHSGVAFKLTERSSKKIASKLKAVLQAKAADESRSDSTDVDVAKEALKK